MCLLIVVALAFEFGLAETDRHIIVLHHVSVCVCMRDTKGLVSEYILLHPFYIRYK